MLFNSIEFAIFFLAIFALYYSPLFKDKQVSFLVAASLIFYAWGQPMWLLLLVFSIAINSFASWRILSTPGRRAKVVWATSCIVANVLILACFKYAILLNTLLLKIGHAPSVLSVLASLSLPIGISFYTFEGISLLVDSLKKPEETPPENGFSHARNTSLFFSFFPHLAAGPIVRPNQLYPQIGEKAFKSIDWQCVLESLIVGYFFKSVIADNLAVHTSAHLMQYKAFSGTDNLVALFGYSARLFADFAGYSLIAIGLGAALGYKLPVNFNFPYRSQSMAEFWTRWHITLSTWIRDYLYIPLGGSKKGRMRTYINLLTVMFLGGLWHGGKVGFAAWGLYHGVILCIERAFGLGHSKHKSGVIQSIKIVSVFLIVSLGWILFVLPLHEVQSFCQSTFIHWRWAASYQHVFLVLLLSLPVIVWHAVDLLNERSAFSPFTRGPFKEVVLALMVFLVLTDSGVPQDFVYFQF